MVRNGIFNLLGQILKVASSILVIPILIKFLGLNLFGLLSWSTAILAAVQLAEGGLSSGLLYFLSSKTNDEDSAESISSRDTILSSGIILLTISTLLFVVIILIATPFLVNTLNGISEILRLQVRKTLLFGSLLGGIRIMQSFFWAILQSKQLYKEYSVISTLQIIIGNIAWVLLAYLGDTYLPDFILSSIIVSALFTGILIFYVFKIFPLFRWVTSNATTRKMFKYNLGVWGSNVGSILFSQGDKLIVASVLGVEMLSVYTIYTSIVSQLNQFAAQAVHPIIPLISSYKNPSITQLELIKVSIKKMFLLNVYISLGGAGLFIILAKPILTFFLHSNFSENFVLPFQLLSFIYGLYTLTVTGYYIVLSIGQSAKVMLVSLFCGISTLVCMYFSQELVTLVLSNAFFFFIAILLFQGMKALNIKFWDWFRQLTFPLITLVIITTLSIFFAPLNLNYQVFTSLSFFVIMIFSFISQYLYVTGRNFKYLITFFSTIKNERASR